MDNQIFSRNSDANAVSTDVLYSLDLAVAAWLHSKANKSGSDKTRAAYEATISGFRGFLQGQGLDLDADPDMVATVAQGWAEQRTRGSRRGGKISNATYNQRLAILSSFYTFARKRRYIRAENPIDLVERRNAVSPERATALDPQTAKANLAAIDRKTKAGMRDYALLMVFITTGRRLSEVASLRGQDVKINGNKVTLHFRRVKGGSSSEKPLGKEVAKALIAYLSTEYGFLTLPDDAPIWVNYSYRNPGQAISIQTIADICERRLGTSKVHSLRHTFAHTMNELGAKVTETKAELGHKSLATTTTYLESLAKPTNPYADAIAGVFGAGEERR
jgi:site-specific recombinase XerD